MCLAIPVQITEILGEDMAKGEVGGIVKEVNLSLVDGVEVGDFVIVHVGFALNKLEPERLEAMAEAEAAGKGAVSLDGRLIDYASIRQAEVLVEKAKQIAGG